MSTSPLSAHELLDAARLSESTVEGARTPAPAEQLPARAVSNPDLLNERSGSLELGKYRLLRALGTGGMGVVYLAEDPHLRRRVAIKVLKDERRGDDQALERFAREARATAALDHPNIVRLYDVSQANGTPYLVMEYVEGTDLQAMVAARGPLDPGLAAGYVLQAAAGLQHAHDAGFVHRDIKPANLILANSGLVKVLDLGLARCLANPADALTDQFDGAVIIGTTDYLSPEQLLNDPFDARSDVYSLGGTLFTLLTGRPPFEGTTAQKLTQHQCAPPRDVCALNPAVPPGLAAVVATMMAKRPEARYQAARDVIAALAPWARGADEATTLTCLQSQKTAVIRHGGRAAPPAREGHPESRLAIGAFALALVACLLYAAFGRVPTPPAPAREPAPAAVAPEPPARKPLHVFDLSGVSAFAFLYRDNVPSDPAWSARVPPGVYLGCWKRESVAEFRGGADRGRPWIGVTNLNNELSAQVIFQFEDELKVPTMAGKQYRVRIEYKTAGDGEGTAAVRNPRNDDFPTLAQQHLENTGGTWRAVELTFRRPVEGKLDVCVSNGAVGEQNLLAVRSVEVFEGAPAH